MKVLLISPETPLFRGGGIATYMDHAIRAHLGNGNQVFVLTWSDAEVVPLPYEYVDENSFEIIHFSSRDIWKKRPDGPFALALSEHITPSILRLIEQFGPDVIESTDYLAPLHHFLMLKRAGLLDDKAARTPVVIYNHGLQSEVYRAAASIPKDDRRSELAAERDVLRWADVVLAPSQSALRTIRHHVGEQLAAAIVPEPFFWTSDIVTPQSRDRFVALGRVSFAKGVDHCIHFLNIARNVQPIEEISFVGSLPSMTFRNASVEAYVLKRLHPDLHSKLILHGGVDRDLAIRRCAGGGYSLNFSLSETFNYAFLELVSAGLAPYVMAETAMAEFMPAQLRDLLIPQDFIDRDVEPIIERTRSDLLKISAEIGSFCRRLADPEQFVVNYANALRLHVPPKQHHGRRKNYSGADTTILMASHNEVAHIEDAVRSALRQTVPPAEVIILDDGSTQHAAIAKLEELSKLDRVRIIKSAANEGLCATRVKLLELCRTKLAVFLDADDAIERCFLERTLRAYNQSPVSPNAVVTWRQNFGASNEQVIRFNADDHSLFLTNDLRMTGLIETDVLRAINFRSSMRNGEADDWNFWLRFKECGYRLVCVPEPLFKYRFAVGTMSWPWSEGQAALTAELVAKRFFKAIKSGQASEAALYDLVAKASWQSPAHEVWDEDTDVLSARRIAYVSKIKSTNPVTYKVLRSVMRLSTSVAKHAQKEPD